MPAAVDAALENALQVSPALLVEMAALVEQAIQERLPISELRRMMDDHARRRRS